MVMKREWEATREYEYTKVTDGRHLKALGQYFTRPEVADFMCHWVLWRSGLRKEQEAISLLDPAVGNSVFLSVARRLCPQCRLTGFEIDRGMLDFFGNPAGAELYCRDYLLNDWQNRYDAIVGNPPYNRFQAVPNREEVLEGIYAHTGIRYSSSTNLYILFLLKSISQLAEHGRLAYIIPSEFFNSRYGVAVKEKLVQERLLRAVLTFQNDGEMFFNAVTTCCILLIDHEAKEEVLFYSLGGVQDLEQLTIGEMGENCLPVSYDSINPRQKWRRYLNQEKAQAYKNLVEVARFCKISRGIATGANDFFCMSEAKAEEFNIPHRALKKCICRSADVQSVIFTESDFNALMQQGKNIYLLDVQGTCGKNLQAYIALGEAQGIPQKYLPAHRAPWYAMEKKPIAPIWVATAYRNGLKFVRNLAGVHSLTTFHSVFIREEYIRYLNIIFCYFLTPIAQTIIRANRRELGNGLEKFQPHDLQTASMLDITLLSREDCGQIEGIYRQLAGGIQPEQLENLLHELNDIFLPYLKI